MMFFDCLKQVVVDEPKTQLNYSAQKSKIREDLINELNPLYQSPSSISSEPKSVKDVKHITNMQEMYNNSVFINFLDSMLPN